MGVIKSMCSAFLMYSRIPVPQVEWKEENRRYALCFFPLVGAVIGALLLCWRQVCARLGAGELLFAAGAVVLPLAVTGGIHMDGFCDVSDARTSYASREKKLEIMSDPHIGAFAVIRLAMYLILQFGLFTQCFDSWVIIPAACSYPLSRAMSGLAAVTFRCAKKQGTLQDFSLAAHKRVTVAALVVWAVVCVFAMAVLPRIAMPWLAAVSRRGAAAGTVSAGSPAAVPKASAAFLTAAFAALAAGASFVYYRVFSYRVFGGITGDLAGYFLQICELAVLGACAVCGLWL